ncbi:MAG TPA: hypothetical protein PKK11_02240 [Methanothrix sp.]|nr:hypothetical protein [Methanothrix sp.]
MPILIGVVAEVFVSELKVMSPTMRLLSVLVLGVAYGGLTNSLGPKSLPISRRMALLLSFLFVLAGILILLASFLLNLDFSQTAMLLGWMAAMLLSLWMARLLPQSLSLARSVLMGAATVSLGAGLALGGAPVVEYVATGGTNDIIIQNNCDTPIGYMNFQVPAGSKISLPLPAVSFDMGRRGNELSVKSQALPALEALGWKIPLNTSLNHCQRILIDGQPLNSGDSVSIDALSGRNHNITIDCLC